MTREHAIKTFRAISQAGMEAPDWIELFVELGMLKLDEPKSAEDKAIGLLAGATFQVENSTHIYDGKYALTEGGARNVVMFLKRAGLNLTEI